MDRDAACRANGLPAALRGGAPGHPPIVGTVFDQARTSARPQADGIRGPHPERV